MRVTLSHPLTVREATSFLCGSDRRIDSKIKIIGITNDSREVDCGYLYFALRGTLHSGEQYVNEAISRGGIPVTSQHINGAITVDDPMTALTRLARNYKKMLPNLKYTVAITGSNGKTTCKNILTNILSAGYKTHCTTGNYNNALGVSITLLSSPYDTEVLVIELGMNHAGEIAMLSRIIEPNVAIITNIGSAHIGNLGSRENIAKAKLEITDGMNGGPVFVDAEEPLLKNVNGRVSVSDTNVESDYCALNLNELQNGYTFDFFVRGRVLKKFQFNMIGRHILRDLLFALAVSVHLGTDSNLVQKRIESMEDSVLRHKILNLPDFSILDDCYNASIESISASLEILDRYGDRPKGALLGDVLELGEKSVEIHKQIGRIAATHRLDNLYLFGDFSEHLKAGAIDGGMDEKIIHVVPYSGAHSSCAEMIVKHHRKNELILIKASRGAALERVIKILTSEDTK